jgi:hypothetical protein
MAAALGLRLPFVFEAPACQIHSLDFSHEAVFDQEFMPEDTLVCSLQMVRQLHAARQRSDRAGYVGVWWDLPSSQRQCRDRRAPQQAPLASRQWSRHQSATTSRPLHPTHGQLHHMVDHIKGKTVPRQPETLPCQITALMERKLGSGKGCGDQGVSTVVAMAGAGALVDEDGHELISCVLMGDSLQLACIIHAQQRSQIQLHREGQLVARLDFCHFLQDNEHECNFGCPIDTEQTQNWSQGIVNHISHPPSRRRQSASERHRGRVA